MRQLFEDGEGIISGRRGTCIGIEELSKLFQIVNKRYVPIEVSLVLSSFDLNLHM